MQTLLGRVERWLAYSQESLENSASEKVNGLTQLLSGVDELQPRKVEELLPDDNIAPDTYILYPTGGYHPFYGVPNTLARYQQKIWPYVKRIKFAEKYKNQATVDKVRSTQQREHHTCEQLNPCWDGNYYCVLLIKNAYFTRNNFSRLKKNGKTPQSRERKKKNISIHRLVGFAWIPNPENKPLVLHINDDPTNYLIGNLKWGTTRENMKGKLQRRPDTMEQKYLNLVDRGVIKG